MQTYLDGMVMAALDRHLLALLVVTIAVALLLVVGIALSLVLGLVRSLVVPLTLFGGKYTCYKHPRSYKKFPIIFIKVV